MQARLPRRATYADLEHTPENMVAEIINGELFLSPRPAPRHANTASVLGSDINGRFHGPPPDRGWWILFEPELHLSEDAYVPDIAGWRRERMPRLPDTAAFEIAPDWICEVLSEGGDTRQRATMDARREGRECGGVLDVHRTNDRPTDEADTRRSGRVDTLSPSTHRRDLMLKLPAYAHEGVAWAWLVDPISRHLEVYRLAEGRWVLEGTWGEGHPDAGAARIPPFEALPIDLDRWWA